MRPRTFITNMYRVSKRCSDLIHAFVLGKVEAGKDEAVLTEVKRSVGVQHATPTYGVYDLHVEVTFKSKDELDRFIFDKIRRIPGVKETVTLIAFERYES
jgi:DNA-binding Lrp family transcriptional regulator